MKAFTLVELLFVQATIGLVAGLLFPVVGGVMINANATKISNNGRNIVYSIIVANLEREAISLNDVWPRKDADFTLKKTDYTKGVSETYFADLISSESVENLPWSVFSGGGIEPATREKAFRAGGHNIWSYVGGFTYAAPDDMPFLFTQNFNISTENFRKHADDEPMDAAIAKYFDPSKEPFGDTLMVVVQKGGGVMTIKKKNLASVLFYGSVSGDTVSANPDLAVVHPK